jgi:hypothetical protein
MGSPQLVEPFLGSWPSWRDLLAEQEFVAHGNEFYNRRNFFIAHLPVLKLDVQPILSRIPRIVKINIQ